MPKVFFTGLFIALLLTGTNSGAQTLCGHPSGKLQSFSKKRRKIPVRDDAAAIKIALPAWNMIYGRRQIRSERPYKARMVSDSIWQVSGTLPKGWVGGVATATISGKDGCLIDVCHGK